MNKEKDKESTVQVADKDKEKSATINKDNNPVNNQGNIGYNQNN